MSPGTRGQSLHKPALDRGRSVAYKAASARAVCATGSAQVAQVVEQSTENARVGGSTPSLGTTPDLFPLRNVQSLIRMLSGTWRVAYLRVSRQPGPPGHGRTAQSPRRGID